MHFFKALLVGASTLATFAAAQSTLAFTSTPSSVTAGTPVTITWAGGDSSSPVTITLRKGDPNDLSTVATLTSDGKGGSYTWTPSKSLASAKDYALQITQGASINYSGQFPLSGGSASAIADPSSAFITPTASVSSAASFSSIIASYNSTRNHTTSAGITPTPVGTAPISSGTGYSASRNQTLSIATLTSSKTGAFSTGASSTGGSTGTSSTSAPHSGAAGISSPLAFVLSAVAAIVYLN